MFVWEVIASQIHKLAQNVMFLFKTCKMLLRTPTTWHSMWCFGPEPITAWQVAVQRVDRSALAILHEGPCRLLDSTRILSFAQRPTCHLIRIINYLNILMPIPLSSTVQTPCVLSADVTLPNQVHVGQNEQTNRYKNRIVVILFWIISRGELP